MLTNLIVLLPAAVSILIFEVSSTRDNGEMTCESVEAIPLCAELGYVNTTFPNLRGHTTPEEANEELSHFSALIYTGCSNAIVHLLCSIYAPVCIQEFVYLKYRYPPCKSLCEYVKNGCADTLLQNFGYSWPPGPHLNCYNYDTVEQNSLCFGPDDPSTLELPSIIKFPPPPANFTSTPLSPSVVEFSWDPSEENEIFIVNCEPQPYEFPLSTNKNVLIARHFIPDTSYTCRVFIARTANIKNSTSFTYFKTPKLGPPHNVAVQHQSAHCVTLSWNHPDEELPQYQKDNYLYLVSCHSQNHDFQQMPRGENAILEDLDPSTEYTCQVSLAPSLTENETATITFTTIEPLTIHFRNNTPDVFNNSVKLEFLTSRPARKISCRILGHIRKTDCSNYRALYHNVPSGTHTVRIVAENNSKDKLVLKIKVYVSGSDPSSCAANLINNRIVKNDKSVILYFRGTNSANQFRCTLNRQNPFECYPPLVLRRLESGEHKIKITPTSGWCKHRISMTTEFTVI